MAGEQASALGHHEVGPELVLLGVEDARKPAANARGSRRHRRIIAQVGLPDGYQEGAAGPLLAALGVDLEAFREWSWPRSARVGSAHILAGLGWGVGGPDTAIGLRVLSVCFALE